MVQHVDGEKRKIIFFFLHNLVTILRIGQICNKTKLFYVIVQRKKMFLFLEQECDTIRPDMEFSFFHVGKQLLFLFFFSGEEEKNSFRHTHKKLFWSSHLLLQLSTRKDQK